MIRIRYRDPSAQAHDCDLAAGIHAGAKSAGRHTVLCLRSGLSPAERRSAIDRLRTSARAGLGPSLPVVPLAVALTIARIRLTLRNLVAAARLHPAGFGVPTALIITGVVLYGLLVTVTIHLGPPSNIAIAHIPLQPPAPAQAASGSRRTHSLAGDPAHAPRLSLAAPSRRPLAARSGGPASREASAPARQLPARARRLR